MGIQNDSFIKTKEIIKFIYKMFNKIVLLNILSANFNKKVVSSAC